MQYLLLVEKDNEKRLLASFYNLEAARKSLYHWYDNYYKNFDVNLSIAEGYDLSGIWSLK